MNKKLETPLSFLRGPRFSRALRAPLTLILLGDPASGKQVQSARICKKYDCVDVDMGRMLREIIASKRSDSKVIAAAMASGRPTPTAIVKKILQEAITKVPSARGIVMDGTPKLAGEARIVAAAMKKVGRTPIVAYLTIPKSEVFKRMNARREIVNGKVIKRSDDNMVSMERRFKYYRTNITKVIEFLRGKYKYARISGLGDRDQIEARLARFIKKNYK